MSTDGPASTPPATAGEVVRGCLASASGTWLELVGPARVDAPDAVHQWRVASRRLRALLRDWDDLLVPDDGRGQMVRDLRWLARALGGVRDLEVLERRLLGETAGAAADHVRRQLDADRAAARQRLSHDLDTARFRRLHAAVEALPGTPVAVEWDRRPAPALVLLARAGCHRALAAWDTVGLLPGADPTAGQLLGVHHARRVAKAARYRCEALQHHDPGLGAQPLAAAFRAVSDELGEVQDTVVAEQYAWRLAAHSDDALVRAVLDAVARDEAGRRPGALAGGRRALVAASHLLA